MNRSIIHSSDDRKKKKERERAKEEKKKEARLRVTREQQLSFSVHSIIISTMSICELTSSDKMMQSDSYTMFFNNNDRLLYIYKCLCRNSD